MDKVIWKPLGEWSYLVDNVLVGVKDVFLSSCPCLNVGYRGILEQKKSSPNRRSPLNSSIDKCTLLHYLFLSLFFLIKKIIPLFLIRPYLHWRHEFGTNLGLSIINGMSLELNSWNVFW